MSARIRVFCKAVSHSAILVWFHGLQKDSDDLCFRSHIIRCGRLVHFLKKLMLEKRDLKNRKSFMFNVFKQSLACNAQSYFLFWFWCSNSSKLHCFEITYTKQCCVTSFLNLAYRWLCTSDSWDLMRNELVEVCRVPNIAQTSISHTALSVHHSSLSRTRFTFLEDKSP